MLLTMRKHTPLWPTDLHHGEAGIRGTRQLQPIDL